MAVADVIHVDRQTRVDGGAITGALVGGTMLGLFGVALINGWCRPDCSVTGVAGGAAMGATVGSAIGGLLGGAAKPGTRAWIQLWPLQ